MKNQYSIAIIIIGFILLTAIISILIWFYMRKQYVTFAEAVSASIDCIIKGDTRQIPGFPEETLLSKVQMRLLRLEEITGSLTKESEQQKQEVQSIVADISHQLKTPIANITMYSDMLSQENVSEEMRAQCMETLSGQVKKLKFLTDTLVKMSRLENGMIAIHPQKNCLSGTLCQVVESARFQAECKEIDIRLECDKDIFACYDEKWTAEALFNLVDNSIKYASSGGKITIEAEPLEMYTKIKVTDTGIGIAPEHINDVCKRFFREEKAFSIEGVGIGLYLTRKIIMMQNGYIKIDSKEGQGTEVAVYLLKAEL